jgi:hypothetical protein
MPIPVVAPWVATAGEEPRWTTSAGPLLPLPTEADGSPALTGEDAELAGRGQVQLRPHALQVV